jgi:hypothetical protein
MDDSRLYGEWSVVRTNKYFLRHGLWNTMEYKIKDEIIARKEQQDKGGPVSKCGDK